MYYILRLDMTHHPIVSDYVNLIIDLQQESMDDARENLFISDLLEHPIIKTYLDRSSPKQKETDYLELFNGPIPHKCKEVFITYQDRPEYPNKAFSFVILSDNYNFPSYLIFTLRHNYTIYEKAYINGELVPLVNMGQTVLPNYPLNSYICMFTGDELSLADPVMVTCLRNQLGLQEVTELVASKPSTIPITPLNLFQFRPIRLSLRLFGLLGAVTVNGNVFGLPYQSYIRLGEDDRIRIVDFNTNYFEIAVSDSNSYYGCKTSKVWFLHELQDVIYRYTGICYMPDGKIIKQYVQECTDHRRRV